jgi:hypothetical protein
VVNVSTNEKEFKEVGTKSIDSRKRITLGKLIQGYKRMRVYVNNKGDILLKPVVEIPADEIWLYEDKKILEEVLEGIKEAEQGKISDLKIDEL